VTEVQPIVSINHGRLATVVVHKAPDTYIPTHPDFASVMRDDQIYGD
jgi:hypothetical protein